MKNLVFLLIFSIPNVWAADYFVRPGISHSVIRNGNSYNTAWGRFSEIDWPSIVAGDSLHLCGKFSETLMLGGEEPKWGGAPGKNITISGVCNENAGSIQGVRNSAVVISRREYITVRDLLINKTACYSETLFLLRFHYSLNGGTIALRRPPNPSSCELTSIIRSSPVLRG